MRIAWLLAASFIAASSTQAAWQKATSRHFVVYSDDTPEHVKTFTTHLELDDKAMRVLHGGDDRPPSPNSRVTVFIVPTQAAVAKLAHNDTVAGFYVPRASESVAFTPRRGDGSGDGALHPEQVLFHEYAHHFMFSSLSDAVIPPWLSEGFAEFHATTAFNADGGVVVGKPPLYRAYGIMAGADESVNNVLNGDPAKLSQDQIQMLYGRGWLLTHFFTTDGERRARLTAYLRDLQQGKPPKEAARALGDTGKLEHELALYMRRPLPIFTIPAKLLPIDPVDVTALTPAESAMMPTLIQSKRGVDIKTAPRVAADARQAAAPYPNDAAAQNELAEAEYDAHYYEASAAAADRALGADPKSLHAMMYAGLSRLAIAEKAKPVDPKAVEAARLWLRRANRADPEWAWPLEANYFSYVGAGQAPTTNAEDGLLYARELAPFDLSLGLTAAYLYLKRNKLDEAKRVLQPVAYSPHGGGVSLFARQVLTTLDDKGRDAALALVTPKKGDDAANKD